MRHTSLALRLCSGAALLAAAACSTDSATGPAAVHQGELVAALTPDLTTAPLLYDQTLTDNGIISPSHGYDDMLMGDDFTVPAGQTWTVGQVMLAGRLNAGYETVPVTIRADASGKPGAVLAGGALAPSKVVPSPCCANLYENLFVLSAPVTLGPGTYWVVAQIRALGEPQFDWHATYPRTRGAEPRATPEGDDTWSHGSLPYDLGFAILGVPSGAQSQTIDFSAILPNPAIIGAAATLSATATSQLPVAFSVSSGSAHVCELDGTTLTYVGVGQCEITASQPGNASYSAAEPVAQVVSVTYNFSGFAAPVENDVPNAAKAGQAIPLRWRLTDASGAPITDLAVANLTVASLGCALGASVDQLEEYAAGGSGLQNLGNGYYQLNWKTPSSYARSCKTMTLDLGEGGVTRRASFHFTK